MLFAIPWQRKHRQQNRPLVRAGRSPRSNQEFEQIRNEVATARENADAKREEAAWQDDAEVRTSVEGVSVETVAGRLPDSALR